MTRIIAGRFAGRRLAVPAKVARPTTDRVREAVFSSLEHRLQGLADLAVMDLFAGSGALGLEALSRGAATVTAVERDRSAVAVLRANVRALAAQQAVSVVPADVLRWAPASGTVFDLVLVDPPYELPAEDVAQVLQRMQAALAPDALVVVERPARDRLSPLPAAWSLADHRRYGETAVWYGRPGGVVVDAEEF